MNKKQNMFGFIGITVSVVVLLVVNVKADNIYALSGVSFFDDSINRVLSSIPETVQTMDWYQGGANPPDLLVQLLNDPTPEHAKAYIQWIRLREERLQIANQLITQELMHESAADNSFLFVND